MGGAGYIFTGQHDARVRLYFAFFRKHGFDVRIQEELGWAPSAPLRDGLAKTYRIAAQVGVETTQAATTTP